MAQGDYLCSDRDLYYIEDLEAGRAVLENCRTGMLMDVGLPDVARLRRVERAPVSA